MEDWSWELGMSWENVAELWEVGVFLMVDGYIFDELVRRAGICRGHKNINIQGAVKKEFIRTEVVAPVLFAGHS
jgi:hypothetical protein